MAQALKKAPAAPAAAAAAVSAKEAEQAAWSSTFLPKEEWPAIADLVRVLTQEAVPPKAFLQFIDFSLTSVFNKPLSAKVSTQLAADANAAAIHVGLMKVIQLAVRSKTDPKQVSADLQTIGVPRANAAEIASALTKNWDQLVASALENRIQLPSITSTEWRVDVTISTTSLSRVFTPTVLMRITLSDGQIRTFECSVEQFSDLRYNIAKALKSVQDLSQHPTLQRDL